MAKSKYNYEPTDEQRKDMIISSFLIDEGLAEPEVFDGVDEKGNIKYRKLHLPMAG